MRSRPVLLVLVPTDVAIVTPAASVCRATGWPTLPSLAPVAAAAQRRSQGDCTSSWIDRIANMRLVNLGEFSSRSSPGFHAVCAARRRYRISRHHCSMRGIARSISSRGMMAGVVKKPIPLVAHGDTIGISSAVCIGFIFHAFPSGLPAFAAAKRMCSSSRQTGEAGNG